MTRHLFRSINELFFQNTKEDTAQEEPIFLENLHKDNAAWSMQKVFLGWAIDTVKQFLTLPEEVKSNLLALLNTIPPSTSQFSWRSWHKLLGTLRSTVPVIAGAVGMFTCLQHALKTAKGRLINLSALVYVELTL